MNESIGIDRWLYQTITASVELQTLFGGDVRYYSDKTPQDVVLPFIMGTFISGLDTKGVEAHLIFTRCTYAIKVVDQTSSFKVISDMYKIVHNLVQDGRGEVEDASIYSCKRFAPWRIADDDMGKEYRQIGGLYEIIAQVKL
jgi:hypothetical protein